MNDKTTPATDKGDLHNDGWQEFSHNDQRWAFNEDELALMDPEDGEYHFYAYHGLTQPNTDQVIAFIKGQN